MRWLVGILVLVFLAGCGSREMWEETAVSLPTASPTPPPVNTLAPLPPTQTPTPVPSATLPPATPTPWQEPSPVPSPTLPPVIDDIWLSGYIMGEGWENCPFQVGNFSKNVGVRCVRLVPVNEEIAAEITTVPLGDTLLKLTGSLDTTPSDLPILTVEQVQYVNFPYTPGTPLDDTFIDDAAGIFFDYPTGWTVTDLATNDGVVITSMPPDAVRLRPGREHHDPTEFFVIYRFVPEETPESWLANYDESGRSPSVSEINVGDWPVTRIEWHVYGVIIEYMVAVHDSLLIFSTNDVGEPFMARVVASLRPAAYADVMVCGYHTDPGRFQVGSAHNGRFAELVPVPVNDEIAAQLAAFPHGDTFLRLTGDITATGAYRGEMLVEEVSRVTYPYEPGIPLTAVYTHTEPAITFNYPAGWTIQLEDGSSGGRLYLHNDPKDPLCARPGREAADPTSVWMGFEFRAGQVEGYLEELSGLNECEGERLVSAEAVTVAGQPATRVVLDPCPWGVTEELVMQVDEYVMVVRPDGVHHDFMEHVLETLRLP